MIQINAARRRFGFIFVMEKEARKLRQNLERYRFLLSANTDARAEAVIRELIAEAQARLREIEPGHGYPDASTREKLRR